MRPRRSLAARLWEKVDRSGGPYACWPFSGAHHRDGYGHLTVWVLGRWVHAFGAHRAAYMVAHGLEDPPKGIVRHTCDNPPCCNPRHLVLGTIADNVRDAKARGRQRYAVNPQRGERNGRAKLTAAQAAEIRALVVAGKPKASIARSYGVSDTLVGRIARGEVWGAA